MNNPKIKTDCFAYYEKCKKSSVLNVLICKKRECTFYKTREQYDEERQKYDAIAAVKLNLNKEVV